MLLSKHTDRLGLRTCPPLVDSLTSNKAIRAVYTEQVFTFHCATFHCFSCIFCNLTLFFSSPYWPCLTFLRLNCELAPKAVFKITSMFYHINRDTITRHDLWSKWKLNVNSKVIKSIVILLRSQPSEQNNLVGRKV